MCPAIMRWYTSTLRWDFSFPISSIFRWPEFDLSYFSTVWSWSSNFHNFRWWFDFSIIDNVVWTLVSLVETIALLSMLCFFFVFCGCTL